MSVEFIHVLMTHRTKCSDVACSMLCVIPVKSAIVMSGHNLVASRLKRLSFSF